MTLYQNPFINYIHTYAFFSFRYLGRRKSVLISLLMVVFAGIIASFSTSYWMFLFFRFIVSIGVSGSIQNCFVLSKKNRKHKVILLRWMVQLLLCSYVNCSR